MARTNPPAHSGHRTHVNTRPYGATLTESGTTFVVYSSLAEEVFLCLFSGDVEKAIPMNHEAGGRWELHVDGVEAGQEYGFRVRGPFDPENGKRCIEQKLLLDPYAKAINGETHWDAACFGYLPDETQDEPNQLDSAPFVPRSVVIDASFDWQGDTSPRTPWADTVIYEAHTKGFTKFLGGVPEADRGTYAGLGSPAATEYLRSLGVTAIELLPIHEFLHPGHLVDRGLRNYWGYDSIGFFAPHQEYASDKTPGAQVHEFKTMVRALHAAGLEVILDVVYNHTSEGNELGPTIAFRGYDNPAYYRLVDDDPAHYSDYTGTGNSLDLTHPQTLQLVMDSLRYWVEEMHVDGFRFDLATTLARGKHEFEHRSSFLAAVRQDPVLQSVKLIAEPWDVGEGGFCLGDFPAPWAEWNGRYRDTVREYWRGDEGVLGSFAAAITGSADLFQHSRRPPTASVNLITAHDGFTLHDLVSYNDRHNEANGEDNADGASDNRSWNCGVEGPTDDVAVLALRRQQMRNLLATAILSVGTPMIVAGDEWGRTQRGNNNAYCQDNEISWLDWEHADQDQLAFTRALLEIRRTTPALRRNAWFGNDATAPQWYSATGEPMTDEAWVDPSNKTVIVVFGSDDGRVMMAFNAHHEDVPFHLPEPDIDWALAISTLSTTDPAVPESLPARSMIVLREATRT